MQAVKLSTLLISVACVAAAVPYTSHFYNTHAIPAGDIMCQEEVSSSTFENACTSKCATSGCYRFRYASGVCHMTSTRTAPLSDKDYIFKKVHVLSYTMQEFSLVA